MKIIVGSGGQTGADQGGLRAAKRCGIETAGYAPLGWKTEDGSAPWLKDYGLEELRTADYAERTRMVVSLSDCVLWFGDSETVGGKCTAKCAKASGVPIKHCDGLSIDYVAGWLKGRLLAGLWIEDSFLAKFSPIYVCIAGNRESKMPGIGKRVEEFIVNVFDILKGQS